LAHLALSPAPLGRPSSHPSAPHPREMNEHTGLLEHTCIFFIAVGVSIGFTCVLAAVNYFSLTLFQDKREFLYLCMAVYLPSLPVVMLQLKYDKQVDTKLGSQNAFNFRAAVYFIIMGLLMAYLPLGPASPDVRSTPTMDRQPPLLICVTILGFFSALSYGTFFQIVSFLPSRGGTCTAVFSMGYQGAGIIAMIMALVIGFRTHPTDAQVKGFFWCAAFFEFFAGIAYMVMYNKSKVYRKALRIRDREASHASNLSEMARARAASRDSSRDRMHRPVPVSLRERHVRSVYPKSSDDDDDDDDDENDDGFEIITHPTFEVVLGSSPVDTSNHSTHGNNKNSTSQPHHSAFPALTNTKPADESTWLFTNTNASSSSSSSHNAHARRKRAASSSSSYHTPTDTELKMPAAASSNGDTNGNGNTNGNTNGMSYRQASETFDANGSYNPDGSEDWKIFLTVAPCVLSIFLNIFASVFLLPFYTYFPTTLHKLPQLLFFTKLMSDTFGRPLTLMLPAVQSQYTLLGAACVRILSLGIFFADILGYLQWSPAQCILMVAVFSAASGFIGTSAYQLAPKMVKGSLRKSQVANMLNFAFHLAVVVALACSTIGTIALGSDMATVQPKPGKHLW